MNQAESYLFRELRFEKNHLTDSRNGAACHYLAWLKQGRCRITTGGRVLEIPQGALFYIPQGCSYQSLWYGEDTVIFDSYSFLLLPNPENARYFLQVIPTTAQEQALLESLSRDKTLSCQTLGRFYTLLGLLLPKMEQESTARREKILREAEHFLSANPHCTNAQLAKFCCVSQSGLYAAFQAAGTTPNALRQQLRLRRAMELLTTTDLPVETISSRLGFSSASYFRKVLKKYDGRSPRQIRKSAVF